MTEFKDLSRGKYYWMHSLSNLDPYCTKIKKIKVILKISVVGPNRKCGID